MQDAPAFQAPIDFVARLPVLSTNLYEAIFPDRFFSCSATGRGARL